MSEMIRRIGMAIVEALRHVAYIDDSMHEKIGRAALEAMRKPTQAMVNAAWYDYEHSPTGVLVHESSVNHDTVNPSEDTAGEIWIAMIDEALRGGGAAIE